MSLEEMLRDMAGESSGSRRAPAISHLGQIARLREFKERLDGGCQFKVGDIVTPRKDGIVKGAGDPQIVVEFNKDALPDFNAETGGDTSYGGVFDIRVAHMCGDKIALHWAESAYYELYTETHEKADPERDFENAA